MPFDIGKMTINCYAMQGDSTASLVSSTMILAKASESRLRLFSRELHWLSGLLVLLGLDSLKSNGR